MYKVYWNDRLYVDGLSLSEARGFTGSEYEVVEMSEDECAEYEFTATRETEAWNNAFLAKFGLE